MENWIDLSEVPKYKGIGTRGKFVNDWKNASGCKCKFYCDGISGYFIIKDYNKENQKVTVLYNEKEKEISTSCILNNSIRGLIGLVSKDFKVEIGGKFIDNNRNIVITDRNFIPDSKGTLRKMYNYHCNVCGWNDGIIDEGHLLNGVGCSCCAKSVVVFYVNDIYTTNPELVKYFKNTEDTHKTTSCSKKKFVMVCPNCKNEQLCSTETLVKSGFSCKKCGDGISYGEKFVYSLLKELNVDFITQLSHTTFDWCGKYKYDFYIPIIHAIIEVHGRQHYIVEKNNYFCHNTKENDIAKEKLATKNGIQNYIVVDCSKSNLEYIQNSIINSELLKLLNKPSNEINWVECDRFTSKSYIALVCDYKNKHPELSSRDIGKVFKMDRTTIKNYLEKGAKFGICIYNKDFERKFKTKQAREKYYNTILFNQIGSENQYMTGNL